VLVAGGDPISMRRQLAGTDVEFVPAATPIDGIRALLARRSPQPDVVHCHMTAAEIAAIATCPLMRAPIVSTIHFAQPRGRLPIRKLLYRAIPMGLRAQIAISEFVANECATSTIVIPNGVPDPGTPSRHAREPVVLVAQRLEAEKNTALALDAWARSTLARKGWRLEIAGRGAEEQSLRAQARVLGIDASVDFVGFVGDLDDRMRTASILLATASREPFGLSVVEALAIGLPVVAANGGAHREIMQGFDDQLFAVDDAMSCSLCLEQLADDARSGNAAARGRARFEERYTIAHHVDRLTALYERCVFSP
jgi:glycosyltransferase involved in cell wall biosynthesis